MVFLKHCETSSSVPQLIFHYNCHSEKLHVILSASYWLSKVHMIVFKFEIVRWGLTQH